MADVATLIAVASSAYTLLRKGFAAGREIESMSKDLSRWVGACHDIERNHGKAKSRRWNKSVEEEALESWAHVRQVRKQRESIRLHLLSIDPNAWNQLLRIEGQIRKARIAEEEARRKRREEITLWCVAVAAASLLLGLVVFVLSRLLP